MAPNTSEGDVLLNRINIALAKSQRQIASWLPPRKEEELASLTTEEDIEKEEQEMFIPTPEVLGIGATVPKDGEVKREQLSSNDKLRKQLLGSDYARKHKNGDRRNGEQIVKSNPFPTGSKPCPTPSKQYAEDDSDDDRGRSSLGKSKQRATKNRVQQSINPDENDLAKPDKTEKDGLLESRPPKRSSNYLDEVLADRSRKKHKKSKKQKKGQIEAN